MYLNNSQLNPMKDLSWLTLTLDVFKLNSDSSSPPYPFRLTLTLDVFKYIIS